MLRCLRCFQARGPCYARARIQQLYQGEDYYLQLDSHFRALA